MLFRCCFGGGGFCTIRRKRLIFENHVKKKFRGEKVRQKVFKGFSDGNQIDKSIRMFLIAFRD